MSGRRVLTELDKEEINKVAIGLSSVLAEYNGDGNWKIKVNRVLSSIRSDWKIDENVEYQPDIRRFTTGHPVIDYLLYSKATGPPYELITHLYNLKINSRFTGLDRETENILLSCRNYRDHHLSLSNHKINEGEHVHAANIIKLWQRGENPLQGTFSQIIGLHYLINDPWYIKFKKDMYTDDCKTNWINYSRYKPFFDSLGSGHEGDLDERCDIIKNKILNSDIQNITLMDGHGRVISRIAEVYNLLPEGRKLNIKVVELDVNNVIWHTNTLPNYNCNNKYISIKGNIFEEFDNDFYSGKKFIYINFSGLVKQGPTIIKAVDLITSYSPDLLDNLLISFSCIRDGKEPCIDT